MSLGRKFVISNHHPSAIWVLIDMVTSLPFSYLAKIFTQIPLPRRERLGEGGTFHCFENPPPSISLPPGEGDCEDLCG